ncbi:hypothetical protein NQ314_007648 [Rhamnusium bicolor]|uniref:Nuclease HARBI1 n=1 Tax=Rhamnusium bicolor TaxID=1586634 RepID=A0AAV8YL96_9CUCU|nr:hypothetical protein NQ314_007648 [Rhamnusium bicolor]
MHEYHAIPPLQQLLLALRFYATGCIYITVSDFGGIHKTIASRKIKRVTESLCTLRANYISMPTNENDSANVMQGFYRLARFPRVIGALDCTYIRIQSPG